MRKLIVLIVACGVAAGVYWRHHGADARKPDPLYNRFWIDHMPNGEKDTIQVFALWRPESWGVFRQQNMWRVELERFRYEANGNRVQAVFPLSGTREDITVKATRCHEADFDFCLEVHGSKHGTTRYYSRLGWERRDRSVEQFMKQLEH
jgi:hypothetical protein